MVTSRWDPSFFLSLIFIPLSDNGNQIEKRIWFVLKYICGNNSNIFTWPLPLLVWDSWDRWLVQMQLLQNFCPFYSHKLTIIFHPHLISRQSCNEDSSKIMGGLCKGYILELEGCLIHDVAATFGINKRSIQMA